MKEELYTIKIINEEDGSIIHSFEHVKHYLGFIRDIKSRGVFGGGNKESLHSRSLLEDTEDIVGFLIQAADQVCEDAIKSSSL